jgi:hypothetical protein
LHTALASAAAQGGLPQRITQHLLALNISDPVEREDRGHLLLAGVPSNRPACAAPAANLFLDVP